MVVYGEDHLRKVLREYARYYNEVRTHHALQKDAPVRRAIQRAGIINLTSNAGRPSPSVCPNLSFRYRQAMLLGCQLQINARRP
jgi:hypothetical protein